MVNFVDDGPQISTTATELESITHLLTLIRHPETVANSAHLLQGSTDSPLSVHGQNQQNALVKAIRESYLNGSNQERGTSSDSPLIDGRVPTHIWSSPLPRALNLATAIKGAYEAKESDNGSKSHYDIPLITRVALEEKSFGDRECSRKGKHVSGFPIGIKPLEGPAQWTARVKQEGRALLEAATTMTANNKGSDSLLGNHLVVVTHGLWISAFFNLFLSSNTMRFPFADNTGIFTFAIDGRYKYPAKLQYRIICVNNVSHLTGLKRQRGGIGSSASDKRQRTLGDMWTKRAK